jgi:hypothetical protein
MTRTSFEGIKQTREACTDPDVTCQRGVFIDWIELLRDGVRLRESWFPVLWPRADGRGQ